MNWQRTVNTIGFALSPKGVRPPGRGSFLLVFLFSFRSIKKIENITFLVTHFTWLSLHCRTIMMQSCRLYFWQIKSLCSYLWQAGIFIVIKEKVLLWPDYHPNPVGGLLHFEKAATGKSSQKIAQRQTLLY